MLARIYRKSSSDYIKMSSLFKEAGQYWKTLVGWEIENCKYIESTKNSHEAKIYIEGSLEDIKKKEE